VVTLHIPELVYYNPEADNFYHAVTLKGMGDDFYAEWSRFKHYFANSAVAVLRRDKGEPDNGS